MSNQVLVQLMKSCEVSAIALCSTQCYNHFQSRQLNCPQQVLATHCNSHVVIVAFCCMFSRAQLNVSDKLSIARWLQQLASSMVHNWTGDSSSQLFHAQHDIIEVGMALKTLCNGCVSCSVHALLSVVKSLLVHITSHDWPAIKWTGSI